MSYSSEVLADSPLAYYRLGEASGSTMVDSSGNGRDGTYTSVTLGTTGLLTGDPDTAATFVSGSGRGEVADAAWMDIGTALTVEAIIKTSATSVYQYIAARDFSTGSGNRLWEMRLANTGRLQVEKIAGGTVTINGTTVLNDGNPHHVAFTYDGSNVRLYVDGTLEATTAATSSLNGSAPFSIGAAGAGTGNWTNHHFQGVIDEVAFYGTTLSGARIAAHHSAMVDPTISGALSATLPALEASLSGEYVGPIEGALAATLPPLAASLSGVYEAPIEGTLAATLPALTASLAGEYEAASIDGTLAAVLPLLQAELSGDYLGPLDTDTSNALNGRSRSGLAEVLVGAPAAAGTTDPARVDKAVPYPTPVMVNGRPT